MKKLILLIFSIIITIFLSGCCHFWFLPAPPPVVAPAPIIIKPGPPFR